MYHKSSSRYVGWAYNSTWSYLPTDFAVLTVRTQLSKTWIKKQNSDVCNYCTLELRLGKSATMTLTALVLCHSVSSLKNDSPDTNRFNNLTLQYAWSRHFDLTLRRQYAQCSTLRSFKSGQKVQRDHGLAENSMILLSSKRNHSKLVCTMLSCVNTFINWTRSKD